MEKNRNGIPVIPGGQRCSEDRTERATEHFVMGPQLAMVYSPIQNWRMLLTPEAALEKGTLFEELYKPLEG